MSTSQRINPNKIDAGQTITMQSTGQSFTIVGLQGFSVFIKNDNGKVHEIAFSDLSQYRLEIK